MKLSNNSYEPFDDYSFLLRIFCTHELSNAFLSFAIAVIGFLALIEGTCPRISLGTIFFIIQ